MCKALEDMVKEGIALGEKRGRTQGLKEGRKEGEKRLAALINRLLTDNYTDEVLAASKSARARSRLYAEYGL